MRHTTRSLTFAALAMVLAAQRTPAAIQVLTPIPACRILDTRSAVAGALGANTTRDVAVIGTDLSAQGGSATGCGIPDFVSGLPHTQALAINLVAVSPAGPGHLVAWPGHLPMPGTSVLNYAPISGLNLANGIILEISQLESEPDLRLFAANSSVDVVADVVGYFTDLGLLGGDGSRIDADTLDGFDASHFILGSGPIDADTLDGFAPSDFLFAADPIDAETIEGHTAEELLRPQSIFMGRATGVLAGDGTNSDASYASPVGVSAAVPGDEEAMTVLSPTICMAKDFRAYSTVAPQGTETLTVALIDNTQLLISCTMSPGVDTCDSAADDALVAPGRRLALRITSNIPAGLSARDIAFGWNCDGGGVPAPDPHDH